MAKFLFDVEQKNRLAQRGLLKRFSIDCYGKQPTIESIRAEKASKFRELKDRRNSREYEEWFLRYTPGMKTEISEETKKRQTQKNKSRTYLEKKKGKSKTMKLPFGIEIV